MQPGRWSEQKTAFAEQMPGAGHLMPDSEKEEVRNLI
jgi:hypothetical protein